MSRRRASSGSARLTERVADGRLLVTLPTEPGSAGPRAITGTDQELADVAAVILEVVRTTPTVPEQLRMGVA